MKETVHAWLCQLSVIDQLCLDAFERRDSQERLCGAGSEASYYVHRRGHATLGVGQKSFVLVKSDEANTRFNRVAYNQSRTSRIPLCTERRPWELLSVWELSIELESGLCEFSGIGDGCYAYSAILPLGLIDSILTDFNSARGRARDNRSQNAWLLLLVGFTHESGQTFRVRTIE